MMIIIIIVIVHPSFDDGLFSAQHMRATLTLLIALSAHTKPLGLRFPVLVVLSPTRTWACEMYLSNTSAIPACLLEHTASPQSWEKSAPVL